MIGVHIVNNMNHQKAMDVIPTDMVVVIVMMVLMVHLLQIVIVVLAAVMTDMVVNVNLYKYPKLQLALLLVVVCL